MTLHTYTLSRSRPHDFKLFRAIARVHLAAWLEIPLMGTIMYRPELTNAANWARYLQTDTESLKNEDEVRFVVVLDDQLVPDETDVETDVEGAGEAEGDGARPEGRVIAAIKYYVVPATGAHPDTETQREIDKQSASSVAADTEAAATSSAKTPHMNHELSDIFVASLIAARQEATQLIGAHVLIDNVYTDPAHHRRGAAGMLMRLAVREADQLGLPCMLEASPMGMKVYESVGFGVLPGKDIWIDLLRWEEGGDQGEEFSERRLEQAGGVRTAGDGWYVQMIMLRPAKSKSKSKGLESGSID
ncbi:uncharacterized protein A1O9_07926 [Exophiala aquamarina CBS 119918]|uniref:N-acetyltransferase domain-containing protein n=1 Tax=Exophiala aquamarina CBS 119918 TaxID=1182545 RepID=A0A072PLG3_9EURO|nr:uncharacterized protein A1O9_07926 [Exophiala aquamarina CBS 119918]KEF56345.1 hypothetical protein A1O9_07926 [Exophiala aquamarina CBS 119918]